MSAVLGNGDVEIRSASLTWVSAITAKVKRRFPWILAGLVAAPGIVGVTPGPPASIGEA